MPQLLHLHLHLAVHAGPLQRRAGLVGCEVRVGLKLEFGGLGGGQALAGQQQGCLALQSPGVHHRALPCRPEHLDDLGLPGGGGVVQRTPAMVALEAAAELELVRLHLEGGWSAKQETTKTFKWQQ